MKKFKLLTTLSTLGVLTTAAPIVITSCGDREKYEMSDLTWTTTPHADVASTLVSFMITKDKDPIDNADIKSIMIADECSPELRAYVQNNTCSIAPIEKGKFKLSLIVETKKDKFKVSTDIDVADHEWEEDYYFIKNGDQLYLHEICSCGKSRNQYKGELDKDTTVVVEPKEGQSATVALNDELKKLKSDEDVYKKLYLPENATIDLSELDQLQYVKNVDLIGRQGTKLEGKATLKNNQKLTFDCVTFSDHTEFVAPANEHYELESLTISNSYIAKNSNIFLNSKSSIIENVIVKSCEFDQIDSLIFPKGPSYWTSLLVYTQTDYLIVENSLFDGAIFNAIQADPGIGEDIVIKNNEFRNIENRVAVFLSYSKTRYEVEDNIMINCNPYTEKPEKYTTSTFWIFYEDHQLIRIGGNPKQTVNKNHLTESNNWVDNGDGYKSVVFEYQDGETGVDSGFRSYPAK